MDNVERHVSKVAFVCDAPATAKHGLPVAKKVIGHAHARAEVVPVFLPEPVDGAIRNFGYVTVADVVENIPNLGVVVV